MDASFTGPVGVPDLVELLGSQASGCRRATSPRVRPASRVGRALCRHPTVSVATSAAELDGDASRGRPDEACRRGCDPRQKPRAFRLCPEAFGAGTVLCEPLARFGDHSRGNTRLIKFLSQSIKDIHRDHHVVQ